MPNNGIQSKESKTSGIIIPTEEFLEHWQGHRRLTRRVIEIFPEYKLFNYSIGGMRPFSAMVMEFIGMADPASWEWQLVNGKQLMNFHIIPKQRHLKPKKNFFIVGTK